MNAFTNPLTEEYLLFYELVLQTFVTFNKFLQREDPLIPVISKHMISFLTKLAGKFLPVSKIKEANGDFNKIQYDDKDNQLSGTLHCIIISS